MPRTPPPSSFCNAVIVASMKALRSPQERLSWQNLQPLVVEEEALVVVQEKLATSEIESATHELCTSMTCD